MHLQRQLQKLLLGLLISPAAFAITLDPVQVETTQGNLLYAEIPFRNAKVNEQLHVELASVEDLSQIGARHNPPNALNFFVRKNTKGEGAIVITSSQPIYQRELDFIIKIRTGSHSRLQHVSKNLKETEKTQKPVASVQDKPLIPTYVVNEQEIALNLAESSRMRQPPVMNVTQPNIKEEKLLKVQTSAPPPLQIVQAAPTAMASTPVAKAPVSPVKQIMPVTNTAPEPTPTQASAKAVPIAAPEAIVITTQAEPAQPEPAPIPEVQPEPLSSQIEESSAAQHLSENVNDSSTATAAETPSTTTEAESFAQDESIEESPAEVTAEQSPANTADDQTTTAIAEAPAPEQKPVAQTTQQPVEQKHLVQANESLWRIANNIAKQSNQSIQQVMKQIQKENQHAFVNGDANRLKKGVVLNLANVTNPTAVDKKEELQAIALPQKNAPAAKTKYKLHDAQMSLVGENDRGSATGTSKKTDVTKKTSPDLIAKVMTSREKSVKLQKVVQQLDLNLQQKDHKIRLLNAKLAQLEAQLKRQKQNAQKP